MKDTSRAPGINDKWLLDLVDKVALQLNVKHEMDILSSEVPKEAKEIEYLRDRTEATLRRLEETESAIAKMQQRIAEPRKRLSGLENEKRLVLAKYERLKETEADTESKLSELPKIKSDIETFTGKVDASSKRLTELKADHYDALQRKEKLEEACRTCRQDLEKLEAEIAVMRNTRDIIVGVRPDGFDADIFETIHEDVEKTLENYINDMEGQIAHIKEEISASYERLDAMDKEEQTLLSKKRLLNETCDALASELGEDTDRQALTAELEALENERLRISDKVDSDKEYIFRLESAISSVDRRMESEEPLHRDLAGRHAYLESRKQEMDSLENAAAEIERLTHEARRLNLDSELNQVVQNTIDLLNSDVEATGRSLRVAIEGYHKAFDGLEKEIDDLLSS